MNKPLSDVVEDRNGLLKSDDHMRDMERLSMRLMAIERPCRSVTRVTGRIATKDPAAWAMPNVAVRIEVETPEGHRPVSRVYTIRSFDTVTGLAEIDFVMHEDDSPAMRWLSKAAQGRLSEHTVWMTGPRAHFTPDFSTGKPAALFADETAIPAVYSILNAWTRGVPGAVWVETCDAEAFAELPAVPGVALHHLLRPVADAAGNTGRLPAAARDGLPDGTGWTIWAGGERQEMREIRTFYQAQGLDRAALKVMGYWKLGMSSSEIDRRRLAAYETLVASGKGLDEMNDANLPI